jgi:hypothetical protein
MMAMLRRGERLLIHCSRKRAREARRMPKVFIGARSCRLQQPMQKWIIAESLWIIPFHRESKTFC